mmetsp:Transcript_70632/g.204702  ORF Transcript_70632/g.204702 Transcript_70632/m.204702 type:complete len:210 (+) Transcript_70632:101-730(+)
MRPGGAAATGHGPGSSWNPNANAVEFNPNHYIQHMHGMEYMQHSFAYHGGGPWSGMKGKSSQGAGMAWYPSNYMRSDYARSSAVLDAAPSTASRQIPEEVVGIWNLDQVYDASSLRAALAEVDFEPDEVRQLADLPGAFALKFGESYMSAAIAMALDRIDPQKDVLRDNGTPVRVERWIGEGSSFTSNSDVPMDIKSGMSSLLSTLMQE